MPDVAALLRAARELPHLQLQGDAQDLRHEDYSSPAAPAAAQAGAAPAPTHQLPLVSGLVLADGRVVSVPPAMQQQLLQQLAMAGDAVTSAVPACTAEPPRLQVLAGSSSGGGGGSSSTIPGRAQQQDRAQPAASSRAGPLQLPSCSTAAHSMAAESACAAASTSGRGKGLRDWREHAAQALLRPVPGDRVWPQRRGHLGGQAQGGTATGPQCVRQGRQHVRAVGVARAVCHAGARHVRGGSTSAA